MAKSAKGTTPNTEIAKRLRAARALTGLDQTDFSDLIGVSRTIVGRYETGTNTTDYRRPFLLAWAYYSHVALDWIVTGQEPMTTQLGGLPLAGPSMQPDNDRSRTRPARRHSKDLRRELQSAS